MWGRKWRICQKNETYTYNCDVFSKKKSSSKRAISRPFLGNGVRKRDVLLEAKLFLPKIENKISLIDSIGPQKKKKIYEICKKNEEKSPTKQLDGILWDEFFPGADHFDVHFSGVECGHQQRRLFNRVAVYEDFQLVVADLYFVFIIDEISSKIYKKIANKMGKNCNSSNEIPIFNKISHFLDSFYYFKQVYFTF